MKTLEHLSELPTLVGQEIAVSDWITITTALADQDAERAAVSSKDA